MLELNTLTNIRKMLDRVTMTGPEAIAWVQAVQAVQAEIARLSTPPAPPAP